MSDSAAYRAAENSLERSCSHCLWVLGLWAQRCCSLSIASLLLFPNLKVRKCAKSEFGSWCYWMRTEMLAAATWGVWVKAAKVAGFVVASSCVWSRWVEEVVANSSRVDLMLLMELLAEHYIGRSEIKQKCVALSASKGKSSFSGVQVWVLIQSCYKL